MMIEIALGYSIWTIGLILYLVSIYYVICTTCCLNERTLISSSDVEALPVLLQFNTKDNPNNTLSHSVKSQIAQKKMKQIQEEHLDDNNNSAFPVTIPLKNGPCYEPVFKDYAGKTPHWYRSTFHNLVDIYNV